MGYFSNGTEGMAYQERYCASCRNCGDDKSDFGCAVWDLHTLWCYDACDEWTKHDTPPLHGPTLRAVLDSLIPITEEGFNGECLMYRKRVEPEQEVLGQMTLLERLDAVHGAPVR
jgi:hypothetical protein